MPAEPDNLTGTVAWFHRVGIKPGSCFRCCALGLMLGWTLAPGLVRAQFRPATSVGNQTMNGQSVAFRNQVQDRMQPIQANGPVMEQPEFEFAPRADSERRVDQGSSLSGRSTPPSGLSAPVATFGLQIPAQMNVVYPSAPRYAEPRGFRVQDGLNTSGEPFLEQRGSLGNPGFGNSSRTPAGGNQIPLSNGVASPDQSVEREKLPLDIYEAMTAKEGRTKDGREVVIQRFPDGKRRIVRHVKQDKDGNFNNHGRWTVFNQAGQVVADGNYNNGVMDGQWRRRHDTNSGGLFSTKPFNLFQGPFLSVARFENGKLEGLWTIYDLYQRQIFQIRYHEGVRDGTALWLYPNQAKMRTAEFSKGLIDGEILEWDENDKLVRREEYLQGRRLVRNTTFYRPNQKQAEDYYLDAKLVPDGEDNWWDAQPAPYVPTGQKFQNGPATEWYENRQPKKRGQFHQGEPVGPFLWWHDNGNQHIKGFYANGKKNRVWTWWYKNGMKQYEGTYNDDQPVGSWRAWDEEGALVKDEDFSFDYELDNQDPADTDDPRDSDGMPTNTLPEPDRDPTTDPDSDPGSDDLEGIEPLEFGTESDAIPLVDPRDVANPPQEQPEQTQPETKDAGAGNSTGPPAETGIPETGIPETNDPTSTPETGGATPIEGPSNTGDLPQPNLDPQKQTTQVTPLDQPPQRSDAGTLPVEFFDEKE